MAGRNPNQHDLDETERTTLTTTKAPEPRGHLNHVDIRNCEELVEEIKEMKEVMKQIKTVLEAPEIKEMKEVMKQIKTMLEAPPSFSNQLHGYLVGGMVSIVLSIILYAVWRLTLYFWTYIEGRNWHMRRDLRNFCRRLCDDQRDFEV
uniref:Uncharacterized protein n=1 Tax=Ditylenchus dipsaci TaxID=166011 RepID=A0A915DFU8_9BILA